VLGVEVTTDNKDGVPVEVTTGVPLAGFNPKYTVETYIPTPLAKAESDALVAAARASAFEEAAQATQVVSGFAELRRLESYGKTSQE
jgi:hypothetical protein